jgi:cytochrome c oxidase subunit 2
MIIRRNVRTVALALSGLLGSAGAEEAQSRLAWMLPEGISHYGDKVDTLYHTLVYTTALVFGLVLAILIYMCVRYRAKVGRKAYFTHGDSWKATALTGSLAVCVFVGIDMNCVRLSEQASEVARTPPDLAGATQVQVVAKQFSWHFRYPGNDGKFGKMNMKKANDINNFGASAKDPDGKDDLQVEGTMAVPVNKPVVIELRSRDVIHSFFLPSMRFKQDCVPGMRSTFWFLPTKTGKYDIACTELCGMMHSQMAGTLKVLEEADYKKWLKEQIEYQSWQDGSQD